MHMRSSRSHRRDTRAFTLVELLVVIGIIALLISILLPALAKAKRQAAYAKCAASLRDIGNAFQMYAIENKGWYPPAQLQPESGAKYNIDGIDYPSTLATTGTPYNAMWFNFLSKYLTKYKTGGAVATNQEAQLQRATIFWGCPSWEGYFLTSNIGGISTVQTGYGMNGWPTAQANYPAPNPALPDNLPPLKETVFIQSWPHNTRGNFFKQNTWARRGAERCLLADCVYWLVESWSVPPPNGMVGQGDLSNGGATFFVQGSTTIDAYRHGKYPGRASAGQLQVKGGEVAFNILYVDGHVSGSNDRRDAFRATRMRFPY
jgi:prepilin-type N-terminal cleavage/methylation domain-containing protein/prepilin-type processing-associated H-X9-DG protein